MVVIIVCLVFIHALPITTLDIIKNNQVRIRGSLWVFLTQTKYNDCHWWNEENRDQSDYPIAILNVLDNVSRTIMEKKSANKMKARSEFSFFLLKLLPVLFSCFLRHRCGCSSSPVELTRKNILDIRRFPENRRFEGKTLDVNNFRRYP